MLLPSDVARLVLGYLQEEGLSATSQAFIHESPNLKEYAEHSTGDGAIPACVFSVFGKGLTTILAEYVAIKTNETCHEVPAMMTSLWKKLDFTLKQIKAMQNSPATSACQRMRSRVGMANLARQRAVTMASASAVVCSSVSETTAIISPALTSHGMLCHSTPVSYAGPHIRSTPSSGNLTHIQDGGRLLNTPRDSPVQIIVSEHRGNPGPMSPGRRKWDTPRKRGGAASGSSGAGRSTAAASNVGAEPQPEEQLVIQNARDRILGDRLLQEKLAENINKILANEPVPQTSKAPSSTLEADQSIDEILGLQGEIHMSDDAIHDILEQTESDPAFQALFDLFDYNKSKLPDGEPGDGDISSCPEETDSAAASTTFAPVQNNLDIAPQDAAPSDPAPAKRAAPERKTRRLTAPTFIKKPLHAPTNRSSRIENSSAKLLISHAEHRGVSSTAAGSKRKDKSPAFSTSVGETPMDIDEFLNNAPSLSSSTAALEAPVPVSKPPSSAGLSGSTTVPSSNAPQVDTVSNMDKNKQCAQTQCSKDQAVAGPSSAPGATTVFLSPLQAEQTTNLPQRSVSSSGQDTQPVLAHSKAPEPASTFVAPAAVVAASVAMPLSAPTDATPTSLASATTSSPVSATLGLATAIPNIQTSPSSALVTAASDCVTTNQNPPGKPTADPSNIVSLKIIISDNQEEDSSGDVALNQAISSISMDKIPTIYLSSPAKSPGGPTVGGPTVGGPTVGSLGGPGTPRTNLDEASLAVSGLQSSEAQVNPISAAAVIASPLTGTSAGQQSYIIQLPLDTTNTGLQAPAASYFVMAEPPTTDAESRQVLVPAGVSSGPPLPTSTQYSVTTPTRPQGFTAGPTLILPSPIKPVMLPVSVMGQNALRKVQMVSNQLVAIQTPVPIQQSEAVKPNAPIDTVKQSTTSVAAQNLVGKVIQPILPESTSKQKDQGPSHRRILCFDSSAKVQSPPSKTTTTTTTTAKTSPSQKSSQTGKERPQTLRTKPAILGGNKPKRRVETIRCSAEPLSGVSLVKETTAPPQQQPKELKKNSRKQDHKVHNQDSETTSPSRADPSQSESLKNSDSGRSKSTDRTRHHEKGHDDSTAKGSRGSGSSSSDPGLKSGSKKPEKSRKEPEESGSSKSRAEKRTPSQEMPNVTANKENEMKSGSREQQQQQPLPLPSSSSSSRDFSPPAAANQPVMNSPTKAAKPSKTISLAKQAAEMLQDIQGFNSPPKVTKKPELRSELPTPQNPAAGHHQEPPSDCSRTPTRPRRAKDGEGTPKHGIPPNTPEVPTCSPASEAGSENSINMAAHTLMILSRAAIARTGTPLKDSLRQEGVGEKSPTSSKNPKKRKQPPTTTSPPAKKESKESSGKKKDRERKKFIDCFPHDLDVDKFLSSLHYDE